MLRRDAFLQTDKPNKKSPALRGFFSSELKPFDHPKRERMGRLRGDFLARSD
jgi:hypothetical protein